MSFPRHREIYRSDGRGRSWALVWSRSWARSWGSAWIWGWARSGAEAAPGAHRFDESPAGYSLAGWSPPEPASASPAQSSMHQNGTERYTFTVNGSLSLIKLSHARGSLHSNPVPRTPSNPLEPPSNPPRTPRTSNSLELLELSRTLSNSPCPSNPLEPSRTLSNPRTPCPSNPCPSNPLDPPLEPPRTPSLEPLERLERLEPCDARLADAAHLRI